LRKVFLFVDRDSQLQLFVHAQKNEFATGLGECFGNIFVYLSEDLRAKEVIMKMILVSQDNNVEETGMISVEG
jgi:hypothetical protein